ncbi:HAUS augmin-like complex subunit 4 [Ophiophagus hannah]|uniref:HAUS augmin-like complex subunit 4 n=1 Tax=Ophiophagus hannah TaxID=8665 RepID=V8NRG4_OPHHA|nr:HAUS augmin-like complex subunit 4 [Ophiophagus hannah]
MAALEDDDLSANPGLANLIAELRKHIDSSGMSIALAQPLEEARKMLQAHRAIWLKWATLYWFLREAVLKPGADAFLQNQKFLETMEQQLLVDKLKWILTPCLSQPNVYRPVLGLETKHLAEFLPPHQDMEQMEKSLPAEVGKLLKAACLQLLSYYHPDSATEKQYLNEVRAQQEELKGCLDQKKAVYSQVLRRCLDLLKRLAREFRLEVQSNLHQVNIQYIEAKCNALLLKIRDELQGSLIKEEKDLATFRNVLSEYEILGPEFAKLVEEYTKLHEIIQNRQWMLAELNKY